MPDAQDTQDPQYAQTLQWARDQLTSLQAQPKIDTTGSPADGTRQSWTSLFGDVLGGGQGPGYQLRGQEADTAGNRALLNFGINMLLASGPHAVKPDVLSAAAQGLQGAQQSLGVDQARGAQFAGAQQEYAQKQQEMQIARIKEAVPLLRLLQGQNIPNTLLGTQTTPPAPNTNIASGGSIAPTTYEGAIAGHEGTGKNPNSSATGVGQFLDSTWQGFTAANPDLFKGMTPDQVQAARNDPAIGAKAINWLAQQNALTLQMAGVTPSGTSLGIAHYLGAKPAAAVMQAPDSAPVKGFVSEAAVKANPELATMTAGQLRARYANTPNPGFLSATTAATPPAAPTAQTPPAPSPRAPVGTPADALPAGGATVAGPAGAATVGAPRPPGPAVPGDVNAIIAGMTGAGANAATLAPGGAQSAPQAPAQVATTAPVVPVATTDQTQPPPSPGMPTWEKFQAQHPFTIDPARYAVSPPTELMQQAKAAQQTAGQQLSLARQAGDNAAATKANESFITASDKVAALQQQADAKSKELRQAAEKDAVDNLRQIYKLTVTDPAAADKQLAATATENEKNRQAAIALKTQEGGQKLAEINAQAGATERTAALNPINTEAGAAAHRLDDLQVLKGFSNNLGDPTFLTSQKIGGHSLADIISGAGLGSQALQDKAGQAQAFRAAALSIVRDLRMGGAAAGEPRSNQDLQFITSMVPSEMQSPATRNAIISYIEQVNQRRMEYGAEVGRLVNTPEFSNNVGGAMLAARQGMKDIIQPVPKELAFGGGDVAQQRLDWFRKNVPPGSFYRAPNGRMQVWHGVKGDPDYAE